jgi:hypothetical protein
MTRSAPSCGIPGTITGEVYEILMQEDPDEEEFRR